MTAKEIGDNLSLILDEMGRQLNRLAPGEPYRKPPAHLIQDLIADIRETTRDEKHADAQEPPTNDRPEIDRVRAMNAEQLTEINELTADRDRDKRNYSAALDVVWKQSDQILMLKAENDNLRREAHAAKRQAPGASGRPAARESGHGAMRELAGVEDRAKMLAELVRRNREAIDLLYSRLNRVLRPAAPRAGAAGHVAPRSCPSPLAGDLSGIADDLDGANDLLLALLSRLDI